MTIFRKTPKDTNYGKLKLVITDSGDWRIKVLKWYGWGNMFPESFYKHFVRNEKFVGTRSKAVEYMIFKGIIKSEDDLLEEIL
jgi:hypothetical protein